LLETLAKPVQAAHAPHDPAFGVYVHWPFCLSKCPYCDFNSHVRRDKPDEIRFVRAIERELDFVAGEIGARTVDTIFFGGGTPSLMQPKTVDAILAAVAEHWPIATNAEITLEANPTSVEAENFRGYRAAGVNRVSLGVQSLDDAALKFLGRLHTADEALTAVNIAQATFPRVSIDLMYARPQQTPAAWQAELARAIGVGTEHVSLYQLTIEDDTAFATLHRAGKLVVPDAEVGRALWDVTQEACDRAGLPAYEISNHARAGAECRHNLVYWRYHEYAGVGPGAHGRIGADGTRRATAAERNPERWLAAVEARGHGFTTDAPLTGAEQADELLLMGLRLREGIDTARYEALSGRTFDAERVSALVAEGLIEVREGKLRVTAVGFPLLDAIVADLAA
jgi:putative oxygen-independent coproporphyrinogen III oxidase